jgi:hypothetical protein
MFDAARQISNWDAELMEEIVRQLAIETGKHIDIIINEVARHYEIEEKVIVNALKSIDSKFVDETNRIVGFIDGVPIKRTTYHMTCLRIFKKLIHSLRHVETFDPTDQNHINFITESMYGFVKSN